MLAMARGWSYSSSAYILSASLFASMLGTIIGGHLSDIHGRKKIVALTMLAAAPLYYAFLYTSGMFSIVLLIMGTALLASSIPIIIILAQRTNPKLAGMASSLVMGLSYTMGALAATPFGALADKIGIEKSMYVPMVLPVIGGMVIFLLKNNRE
jgi:FSR family fosmidomycin resistance protein-like MFS transporter